MGLEEFKTEGPRTFTEEENRQINSGECIHILKGTDPDLSDVPNSIVTHKAICREIPRSIQDSELEDMYVCDDCTRVCTSYEAMLKTDKLELDNPDWFADLVDRMLTLAEQVDREDTLDDFSVENREKMDVEQQEQESDPTTGSGLESFMS